MDVITIKQFLIKNILPDNSRYIYYATFLGALFLFYWIYWGGIGYGSVFNLLIWNKFCVLNEVSF